MLLRAARPRRLDFWRPSETLLLAVLVGAWTIIVSWILWEAVVLFGIAAALAAIGFWPERRR